MPDFDMICCIVNAGQGSKALKIAKHSGITGGTIFMGMGTVSNRLLEILGLDDVRREFVFMAAKRETAHIAVKVLSDELAFSKPNHGISFILPLIDIIGAHSFEHVTDSYNEVVTDSVYRAIFTVVDRGRGSDVVEAANAAGARGATIIHARGAGIHETDVLFAMPIEPEKDMVLILAKSDICKNIVSSINEQLHIDEAGTGIIFTMEVSDAHGLY